MANAFTKAASQHPTVTMNGALSVASSGSLLIDQFGKAGTYRNREVSEVFAEQASIWDENPEMALRFPFYLRLITRKIRVKDGIVTEKVQRGQGVRDEAFKRLLWIAAYHKDSFYNNLWLLPIVGSWKDLWTLMYYDITLGTKCLDNEQIYKLIIDGVQCEEHIDLIKKFMPRIKSASKLKTEKSIILNDLAKEFAKFAKMNVAEYNKFKSSGCAHDFQKLICGQMYDKINWKAIPGKALQLLVNSKFLENHGLIEAYTQWLDKQPIAKFNGYPYELANMVFKNPRMPLYKSMTINKQFNSLIETAKDGGNGTLKGNIWCALDTSGSMTMRVAGDISAYDICLSLGVYFSTLNEGAFHKNVIMFDSESRVKQLSGNFCDMLTQIRSSRTAWGSTNFQSVIEEIVRIRTEHPEIPLEDFPTTLLVVSDMQFNPVGGNTQTNYEAAKSRLATVFPTEWVEQMKFVWWNVNGRYGNDVPATMEDGGCYLFSGFDGAIISLLLGGEEKTDEKGNIVQPSMEEMVQIALSQEILEHIKVA